MLNWLLRRRDALLDMRAQAASPPAPSPTPQDPPPVAAAAALPVAVAQPDPGPLPAAAEAALKLGQQRLRQGDGAGGLEALRAALQAAPQHLEPLFRLGAALRQQGQPQTAIGYLEAVVHRQADHAEARRELGAARLDLGQGAAAAEALQKSLALQPGQPEVSYWLGHALMMQGLAQEARQAYEAAVQADPQHLRARWSQVNAQIVPVAESEAAEAASHQAYEDALQRLIAQVARQGLAAKGQGFEAVGCTQPMYLAYQSPQPKALLQRLGRMQVDLMAGWHRRAGLRLAKPPATDRLRLGIASAHLFDHSVWNALVRGWLEALDRQRVEVELFQIGTRSDAQTAHARSLAHRFHGPFTDWQQAAGAIAGAGLHVLLYPEVGLDSTTAKLASLRLVPRQVASWGHPVTTGLPTIDAYLSAAALEPDDAQDHYSERLLRLPGLGCTPRRHGTRPAPVDLQALGLQRQRRLLVCPGMPFKYRPAHDRWWVEMARRCDPCTLVFFRGGPPVLADRFQHRLQAAFTAAGLDPEVHLRFVPWQSQAAFFGLLQQADLMLDSPGFSGFNTVMQGLESGIPVLAWEGPDLRGRLGSGVLRHAGLSALVATDATAWVDTAARLCQDAAERARWRRETAEAARRIFDDRSGCAALESTLRGMMQTPASHGKARTVQPVSGVTPPAATR